MRNTEEKLFVGHLLFHGDDNRPPVASFGSNWNETLLAKKAAAAALRRGTDEEWEAGRRGDALVHCYVTKSGKTDYLVCPALSCVTGRPDIPMVGDPSGCPAPAEAVALLASTKKETP